ncbi:MAG: response regulator, partial [Bacteroidales bacterium]|nr:response regulator [Bacteroidales bacterium]
KDDAGYMWMASNVNRVRMMSPTLKPLDEIVLPEAEVVNVITADHNGNVIFGTSHGRVLVYDADIPCKYREIISSDQNNRSVTCFYVKDDNTILVGTDGRGIKILVKEEEQWNISDFKFSIADNSRLKVHHIMCDSDGNYWIGCFQKGVLVVRDDCCMFDYIGHISLVHDVVGDCCVMSVYTDSNKNIYVGTDNDGVYMLDEKYNLIHHYSSDEPGSLVPKVTLSICEDSYGRLWMGGYQDGLVYLDRETGRWHRFDLSSDKTDHDDYASVYAIVEDKKTHSIWASASGVGLYKIDEQTLQSKVLGITEVSLMHNYTANQICNTWVICMTISSDRKLYIGTFSGISCMDLDTENFVSTYGVNCFMSGYVVNNICEAPNGHIWLGTTEGLFDFDIYNRTFHRYGTEEGMLNYSVSGIAIDKDGRLWISTKNGVANYDPESDIFSNYNATDGLYTNEFISNAVSVAPDGRIIFGAVDGVVCFYPFPKQERNKELKLRVVNFIIDNKPVFKGFKSGDNEVVDTSVLNARRFHLAHFDNSFDVEFSTFEFENPERLFYSYRLDGGQWSNISGNRVSFAKLNYGIHTLEARVTDNDTTSDTFTITIEIDFPWYRTTWFYALLVFVVLALIAVVVKLIMRRIEMRNNLAEISRAKEFNDSRIEFFTNISHEIRTPISLIITPLYKLMDADDDPARQRSYRTIKLNAQRILNLINQLLDMRKIDSDQMALEFEKIDIVAFCRGVYESFDQYAVSLGVGFSLDTQFESLDVYIDPKNFDKVIVNLLSNAFKYTPKGGNVILSIYSIGDTMVGIDVSDQGTGMSNEDTEHIFDLFYQGDNSHKITMVGTGVGMYLVRKLVTLHHGEVSVVNNPGGVGCTFSIQLPLGREHLSDDEIFERDEVSKPTYMQDLFDVDIDSNDEELRRYIRKTARLVVVDDDEELRKYMVGELSNYFRLTDFPDAESALPYINKNKPDVVITDVMMGDMDGISLCAKIKRNVETNTIPVIMLTADVHDDNRIKALDIGADAYITKPFNLSVLTHTIANLLKRNLTLKNSYLGRQDKIDGADMDDVDKSSDSPDKKLLLRVLKVINENMSNPNLTVDVISKAVGISRVHLHRKLKELTNQSTIDFLRNVRLNRALKLLRIKHNSISEVAQQVGFVSTAYFSTVFKDRFGCTPSAYMSDNATIEQLPIEDDELIS